MTAGKSIRRSTLFTGIFKNGSFACKFLRSPADSTAKASCA